ncbi:MAG: nucleotidyltransferase family protein [Clostridia bacterium]|nr:nucleotidyltransferase family protein [Clostridia bacterium]
MLDQQKCGVIALMRSALTGEKIALAEDFDLVSAAKTAKRHQVGAAMYYGALNCGFSNDHPAMQALFMITCQYVSFGEQQRYEIESVCAAFDRESIDYMPLKGTLLKPLYPKPEMRVMSDADILIRTEQYDRIRPVMQQLGFTEKLESDHELVWQKGNMVIELHKRLIPSYNKDYFAYFGDGWRLAKVESGTRYTLSDEDHMIYLFTHFAKHYRDGGIGLKHMTDLWVFLQKNPNLDEKYIEKELKTLQLNEFYGRVMETLQAWFGGKPFDEMTEYITQTIFASGAFGTVENRQLSQAVKQNKAVGSAEKLRRKRIVSLIFPGVDALSQRYPVVKKCPILLPFFWPVRWVTALLFRRENVAFQGRQMKNVTPDQIDSHEKALQYVGLDFNFKE